MKTVRVWLFLAVFFATFGCASQSELPTILAKKIYLSDLNRDGLIDAADAEILFSNYGKASPNPLEGDLNGDGVIDEQDFEMLLRTWSDSDKNSGATG